MAYPYLFNLSTYRISLTSYVCFIENKSIFLDRKFKYKVIYFNFLLKNIWL